MDVQRYVLHIHNANQLGSPFFNILPEANIVLRNFPLLKKLDQQSQGGFVIKTRKISLVSVNVHLYMY